MENRTRNLDCYLCRKRINVGQNKKLIRKGVWAHSSCNRKPKKKGFIDWLLGKLNG